MNALQGNEYCGGPNRYEFTACRFKHTYAVRRLDMYKLNGSIPVPTSTKGGTNPPVATGGPSVVPSAGAFTYAGCYTEATNGRALNGLVNPVGGATLTIEKCAAACSKYMYFGTEYSGEWYVSVSLPRPCAE